MSSKGKLMVNKLLLCLCLPYLIAFVSFLFGDFAYPLIHSSLKKIADWETSIHYSASSR